jgi:ABC-type nitrate/sulfonate/bicarbonate transport system permease component
MVGAELIASTSGIGFMMMQARQYLDTETVIVTMIAIGLVWVILDYGILRQIERVTIKKWGMVRG